MKILLIVDVQNDFCLGGSLAVPGGDDVVPVINDMMESNQFDRIIASKDWHPANHVSFAASHPDANLFDVIEVNGCSQVLWPIHCVEGTSGADLHPMLDSTRINHYVLKGRDTEVDSYSAFFDNAHDKSTGLLDYLREQLPPGQSLGTLDLIVCGLATDYCVKASAMDAARLGINTTVVFDACRSVAPQMEVKTLREMADVGVQIITHHEFNRGGKRSLDPLFVSASQTRAQEMQP